MKIVVTVSPSKKKKHFFENLEFSPFCIFSLCSSAAAAAGFGPKRNWAVTTQQKWVLGAGRGSVCNYTYHVYVL
jgi:hypothetical protein